MTDDAGRTIEVHEIVWNGITIQIRYERNYLSSAANLTAHFEIRVIRPEREPIPITDTGYRSHFLQHDVVEGIGGPVAYVTAWLDAEAKTPGWRKAVAASRQLDLFG